MIRGRVFWRDIVVIFSDISLSEFDANARNAVMRSDTELSFIRALNKKVLSATATKVNPTAAIGALHERSGDEVVRAGGRAQLRWERD
jgi:hypothetical protein